MGIFNAKSPHSSHSLVGDYREALAWKPMSLLGIYGSTSIRDRKNTGPGIVAVCGRMPISVSLPRGQLEWSCDIGFGLMSWYEDLILSLMKLTDSSMARPPE